MEATAQERQLARDRNLRSQALRVAWLPRRQPRSETLAKDVQKCAGALGSPVPTGPL
jgi:hypothetical protein